MLCNVPNIGGIRRKTISVWIVYKDRNNFIELIIFVVVHDRSGCLYAVTPKRSLKVQKYGVKARKLCAAKFQIKS